ncbi:MAG: hypothetical protein GKS05_07640 [Nitrospirales bacterium]|nr:hypothetical protein [Nitrospirales bacterium]
MIIEVESNANVEASIFLRFKELGPAKPITHLKSYERSSRGEWCAVVGWSEEGDDPVGEAWAQPIEDSGSGFGYVVFGGTGGIRLRPVSVEEAWNLESPHQWGEAYLSLASKDDLRFKDPS